MARILKEIKILKQNESVNGIFIDFDDNNAKEFKILFFGPPDSVFHHGVFVFKAIIPDNYPFTVPKVEFITGGIIQARIHPNLYKEGKVCVSMLNTWGKNEWTPLLTMEKVMMTIRALLDDNPISHEPSKEGVKKNSINAINYSICSTYYSIKSITDVYNFYKNTCFGEIIRKYVKENVQSIIETINSLKEHDKKKFETFHHNVQLNVTNLSSNFETFLKELEE